MRVELGGGVIFGLLGILFVAFKLLGIINWSWVWVTAPFWGVLVIAAVVPLLVMAVLVISAGVYALIMTIISRWGK